MLARNEAFPRTAITADGMVEGYASLFGEIDSARDMVMPGAFAQTLQTRGIRRIPMLFQHDLPPGTAKRFYRVVESTP